MIITSDNLNLEFSQEIANLVNLLRYRAIVQPNKVAFTFVEDGEIEKASLTYGELDRQARAIAVQLQSHGVAGDRALLLYPPGLEFIAAFFGCLYSQTVAVPAYPPRRNQNLSRLQAIASDAKAKVALTTTSVLTNFQSRLVENPELASLQWLATDDLNGELASNWQKPEVSGDTLAFLQYTSGSTGIPKGVMLNHRNLLHNEEMIRRSFQHTEESIVVGWLPLFHDMGLIGNVLQPLYLGIPSILMSPVEFLQQPLRWLKAISRYKATTSGGPNFAYDLCVHKITPEQRQGLDLSSWSLAFNGAEYIRKETLDQFAATFAPCGFRREAFYPCYGMAETTLFVSGGEKKALPVVSQVEAEALEQNLVVQGEEHNSKKIVGCGHAWLDEKIVIANPKSLRECSFGEVGEIWVSGANVAQGYWNRPTETEKTFHAFLTSGEGPFLRTGDLGFIKDGELFVTGRLKDVIIIRGRNHYPQDIELTVEQSHPALNPGCGAAFAVEIDGEERLVVVQEVERSYLRKLDVNQVAADIRKAVAQQHELQVYGVVLLKTGSLPKTSSGKIQRHACRSGFIAGSLNVVGSSILEQTDNSVADTNITPEIAAIASPTQSPLELTLRDKIAQILKIAASGLQLEQPLHTLGIDSLQAIAIKNEIESNFGLVLPIEVFLEDISISELAARIRSQERLPSPSISTKLQSTVQIQTKPQIQESSAITHNQVVEEGLQFSLFYFSSNEAEFTDNKYKLLIEGAKFADQNDFTAVWIPERHFHAFGGLYPNPSVLAAALAMVTQRVRIRAGSVVLPLQNPIRVAEEWSVVDNLSQGRVDLGFARGWNPNDFVLSPDTYANSTEVLYSSIEKVQKLWQGKSISLLNGIGQETEIQIYPLPKQQELAIWLTCSGSKERFIEAGASGFNILTALLFQSPEELAEKIALYRQSRAANGHDPNTGRVTLMLHTFIGDDINDVRQKVREPFIEYLKTSVNLWRQGAKSLDDLNEQQRSDLLAYAFERYFQTSALFGTPETCLQMVNRLEEIGVNEIASLIDFGIDGDSVIAGLDSLKKLKELANQGEIPDTATTKIFPLSRNQQALWFLYKLAPKSPAYNTALTIRICGNLDKQAWQNALQKLVERHPILRATFTEHESESVQEIRLAQKISCAEIDARNWTEARLKEEVIKAYQLPFDLQRDSVLRASLFTRSEQEHVFLLVIHHIVRDGWSVLILLDELQKLYSAAKAGTKASLPPIKYHYSDYVQWQTQMLSGAVGERLWQYWQQKLSGKLPILELPSDRPRPPVQTYQGASHVFQLTEEMTARLKGMAKAEKATLFTLLLASFQVLLHRYTGAEDILVGSPFAGRQHTKFARTVGHFVNSVVLRANLAGNPTFKAFLAQVRQTVLEAIAHQDYPFALLVERLQPNRDLSHTPLFQVNFVYLQQIERFGKTLEFFLPEETEVEIDCDDLQLKPFVIPQEEGQFDLTLEVVEASQSLFAAFKYNTDLFDPSTIERMAGHFQTMLEGILAQPEQPISQLPLLSQAEQQQLLVESNQTQTDYPQDRCIHQLFEEQVERTPDAVAVVFDSQQLTYRQLNERANQLANYLRTLGVKPEVLVGICVERSLEMVVGMLGILKAGAAYVPLDPAYPDERLSFMLSDAQVPVLLTQQQLVADLPNHEAVVVCLDSDWHHIAQQSQENPITDVTSHNLAYTIYTSGSTGKPKGVQIIHNAVVNFLCSMRQQPGMTADDVLLGVTTFTFDIAVLEIFLPMIVGACLVMAKREVTIDGKQLLDLLINSGATVMQATPATWRLLLEAGWQTSHKLKILCGGEALPRKLANELQPRSTSLWNVYGPTETTIWSLISQVESEQQLISIGHPIANTEVYILDRHLQPVPIGVPGELHIGGAGLARGYLNRPELTAEKFIPNPFYRSRGAGECGCRGGREDQFSNSARLYKTGDLVRYLGDRSIEYLGRIDFLVKIRGFRIELGEIEAVLSQDPSVLQAVVIVREDIPGERRLVAYVVPNQELAPTTTDLRRVLKDKLPDYMIPSAFVILETLPLTPNGKVDRRALPAPQTLRPEIAANYEMPQTETEILIATIWQETLQLEKVGIHDNFFDLGGHSLLMVQIHHKLQKMFAQEISMIEMFKYPTINSLAKHLTQNFSEKSPSSPTYQQSPNRHIRRTAMNQQRQLRTQNRSFSKS
ncbi:amino acid adenylation domain-containing protein [Nostoc sp. CENA67]|uniref:Amino acid adenylation domain-containing protein n=1 Tax=Amazonocrinis nigriterrae CENA67 TaxID=2794033 RepID=A0A8J7LBQ8_9NOST|nr:non-ribosomal peptide synthetase [Amazonocrinis nigriterrae]MBH8567023.1 amino acid adenylation domain-containing protein [Amazonocrinis nigriterrae CENA67]